MCKVITPDRCRWKGCTAPHPRGRHPKKPRPGRPVRMEDLPHAEYHRVMGELFDGRSVSVGTFAPLPDADRWQCVRCRIYCLRRYWPEPADHVCNVCNMRALVERGLEDGSIRPIEK